LRENESVLIISQAKRAAPEKMKKSRSVMFMLVLIIDQNGESGTIGVLARQLAIKGNNTASASASSTTTTTATTITVQAAKEATPSLERAQLLKLVLATTIITTITSLRVTGVRGRRGINVQRLAARELSSDTESVMETTVLVNELKQRSAMQVTATKVTSAWPVSAGLVGHSGRRARRLARVEPVQNSESADLSSPALAILKLRKNAMSASSALLPLASLWEIQAACSSTWE